MEKIFKKSLALMVSAALCLTAFVGCLTVNAETAGSATVKVGEVTAKTTDTTVEVPVTIEAGEDATTGIAAAIFDITVDSAKFNFSKRYWDSCLTYDTAQNIHVSTITNGDYIQPLSGTENTYRFLVEGLAEGSTDESTLGTFTSATFKLTFDVIDNTAGETAITFASTIAPQACNAGTFDIASATYTGKELMFDVTATPGSITVGASGPVEITATYAHSVSFDSSLALNIYLTKTDEWAACDMLYMEVEKEDYSSGELSYVKSTIQVDSMTPVKISGAYRYRFVFDKFDARQLGDWFTGIVYGVDSEGNKIYASANSDRTCVLDYCLGRFVNSTSETLKKLCAAVLNYGAEAQKFFGSGYRLDTLVNEVAEVKDYVTQYTDTTERILNANSSKAGTGVDLLNTVNCQSRVELICAVKKTDVSAYNLEDLKYVLTYNGKTETINGSDFVSAGSYYYGYLTVLKSYDFSKDITIQLYNGDTLISITRTYSIEAYGMEQISKHSTEQKYADFYTSMIKYSDASAVNFNQN